MTSDGPRPPRSPLPFTLGVAALAGVLTVAAPAGELPAHWPVVIGPLVLALGLAGVLQVKFQYREHVEAIDLFESALLPLLFLFPVTVVVPAVALTKAASQLVLRIPRSKALFNTAQWSAAAAAASAVLATVSGRSGIPAVDTRALGALGAAAVTLMVVNHAAVVTVIGIVGRHSFGQVLRDLNPVIVPGWVVGAATNLSFGLLFTLAVVAWPGAAFLVAVPLAVLHWATRAYAAVRADRARLAALQAATHELGVPVDPRDAVGPFLERVRSCFEADAVELVLLGHDEVVTCPADAGTTMVSTVVASAVSATGTSFRSRRGADGIVGDALAAAGRRDVIAVPLRWDGRVVGALVSYDRAGMEGFEEGEIAVLEALAGELAAALHRSDLLASIIDERRKLSDIVSRSSDGIFTIAEDGVITSWNPAMERMTGFTAAEMVGTSRLPLLTPGSGGAADALENWSESLDLPAVVEIASAGGDTRWLACTYASTGADVPLLVVVARDITRARELEQLKDDFIASVSHELRTPLTTIAGFSQMLVEDGPDMNQEERDDAAVVIRRGARRLERLVLNLLEVSRIESQRTPAMRSLVDIDGLCEQVVDELRRTWPDRDIRVRRAGSEVRAVGNELSIDQIVHNLVGNALKYAPASPIEVTVTSEPTQVEVEVRDFGLGIPAGDLERIFERFERLDRGSEQPGTGLGLYIARQLARGMQGELSVRSSSERGTAFTLTLPAHAAVVTTH